MALSTLTIDLAANVARFESDLKRAQRVSKRESEKMRKDAVRAGKLMGAAFATAATGLAVLVKKQIDAADEMQKLGQRTGATTEFLSEMKLAVELSGIEFGTFTNAMGKMQKAVGDGVVGLSTQKRAFEELRIDVEKFQKLDVEQQFEQLAESLSKVKNASQQVRIARDIFGRSGQELLSLFKDGAEGIRKFREEAQKMGLTISQDLADNSADLNDNLSRLRSRFSAVVIVITEELLPILNEYAETLLRSGNLTANAKEFADGLVSAIEGLAKAFRAVKENIELVLIAFGAMAGAKFAVTFLAAFGPAGLAAAAGIGAISAAAFVLRDHVNRLNPELERSNKLMKEAASNLVGLTDVAGLNQRLEERRQQWIRNEQQLTKLRDEYKRYTDQVRAPFDENRDRMAAEIQELVDTNATLLQSIGALRRRLDEAKASMGEIPKEVNAELEDASDRFKGLTKGARDFAKSLAEMMKQIKANAEGVRQSLLTPLEALREEFTQNELKLQVFISSLERGTAEYEQWTAVLARLRAEFKKQEAALEGALTPYQALVQTIEREIELLQAGEQARLLMIARWELERSGIQATNEELEHYLGLIKQRNELILDQQGFDEQGRITDFASVIRRAVQKGIDSGFEGFAGNLKKAVQSDPFGFAGGIAESISAFQAIKDAGATTLRALAEVVQNFDPTGITKALLAIDNLFGGKLFGTSFATDKAIVQLGVDAAGAFGSSSTFQSKERSFFRGTERRVLEEALTGDALKAIQDVFDAVQEAIEIAARALAVDIPSVVAGAFEQEFDAEGNLVKEFSTVLGRVFEESFQAFAQRLIAENILAAVSEAVGDIEVAQLVFRSPFQDMDPREIAELGPGRGNAGQWREITVLVNEAQHIAERWREDAAKLLEGAHFLLAAVTDIRDGFNLLGDGTLTELTDLVEDLSNAGEELAATYARVKADTELLELALRVMNTELGLTREEFVRFAVDIEVAAGGLQRAAQLWGAFFETFMTENERTVSDLAAAAARRDELLAGIGEDAASFEAAFRAALPTLTPQEIVTWLEAAEAIGTVIELEEALAKQRTELLEIFAETGVLSNFQAAVLDLQTQFEESIKRAEQLGASERELALIRTHAERNMARLVGQLEIQTAQLAAEFLGVTSERLAALEEEQAAIEQIRDDRRAAFEAERQAIQRLREFADSLLLNQALTPLTPREQLAEARRQFESTLGRARGGDANALGQLQGSAQSFLTIARDFFASSPEFSRIFDQVQGSLRGLEARNPTVALTTAMESAEQEIATLRATMEANNEALQRFQEALQLETLLSNLRDLASIGGQSIEEVAAAFGLDLGDLIAALEGLGVAGFDPSLILSEAAASILPVENLSLAVQPLATSIDSVATANAQGWSNNQKANDRIIEKLERMLVLLREQRDQTVISRRSAA